MRTNNKFILDENHKIIPVNDLLTWAIWFEKSNDRRRVARDAIGGGYVSTVFLGLDHNFDDEGEPILWETRVFGGELDGEMTRCAGTWEQAEAMHTKMVERVKACVPWWSRAWHWLVNLIG